MLIFTLFFQKYLYVFRKKQCSCITHAMTPSQRTNEPPCAGDSISLEQYSHTAEIFFFYSQACVFKNTLHPGYLSGFHTHQPLKTLRDFTSKGPGSDPGKRQGTHSTVRVQNLP